MPGSITYDQAMVMLREMFPNMDQAFITNKLREKGQFPLTTHSLCFVELYKHPLLLLWGWQVGISRTLLRL